MLGSEDDGLEVVDPASFVLQPGDLRESFTQSLLDRLGQVRETRRQPPKGSLRRSFHAAGTGNVRCIPVLPAVVARRHAMTVRFQWRRPVNSRAQSFFAALPNLP